MYWICRYESCVREIAFSGLLVLLVKRQSQRNDFSWCFGVEAFDRCLPRRFEEVVQDERMCIPEGRYEGIDTSNHGIGLLPATVRTYKNALPARCRYEGYANPSPKVVPSSS